MTGLRIERQYVPWLLALAAIAALAASLFGMTGLRTILAIALLFVIPTFLLLRKTELDAEEKIFFSLFTGLGFFPLTVWLINQLLPSFRGSIIAAFAAVAAASIFLPKAIASIQGKKQR